MIQEMTVSILPIGEYSQIRLERIKGECETFIGVNVEILEPYPLPLSLVAQNRRQLDSSALMRQLNHEYPERVGEQKLLMGFIHEDIFIPELPHWQFAFAARDSELMTAIISSFRLDPVTFGEAAQESLLETRLRKLMKRQIGILLLNRTESLNPRSLFYHEILGLEDVDRIEEEI